MTDQAGTSAATECVSCGRPVLPGEGCEHDEWQHRECCERTQAAVSPVARPRGVIVKRTPLTTADGDVWETWVTVWTDGRRTITFHTPNDPESPFYGEDGPRFDLADVREAASEND